MKKLDTTDFLIPALLGLLFVPRSSFGYIDAGTGSFIIQILAAGLFATLFAVKVFWLRIKSFFGAITGRKGTEDKDAEGGD